MIKIYTLVCLTVVLIFDISAATLVRGPYLNMATQNSVHIRWRTSTPVLGVVHYGTADTLLNGFATDGGSTTEHDVTIPGLSPDTKYFYSIGANLPLLETYQGGPDNYF